jgi:hypothetical protein
MNGRGKSLFIIGSHTICHCEERSDLALFVIASLLLRRRRGNLVFMEKFLKNKDCQPRLRRAIGLTIEKLYGSSFNFLKK